MSKVRELFGMPDEKAVGKCVDALDNLKDKIRGKQDNKAELENQIKNGNNGVELSPDQKAIAMKGIRELNREIEDHHKEANKQMEKLDKLAKAFGGDRKEEVQQKASRLKSDFEGLGARNAYRQGAHQS